MCRLAWLHIHMHTSHTHIQEPLHLCKPEYRVHKRNLYEQKWKSKSNYAIRADKQIPVSCLVFPTRTCSNFADNLF